MKFAFISHLLPPTWGGQTIMIYRVLLNVSPEAYCLISPHNYEAKFFEGDFTRRLPARYYQLPPDAQLTRGYRFGLAKARAAINVPLGLVSRARGVARIVQREGCQAVVACTGSLLDLPAGYLASRLVGVPFYAYMFDYYSYSILDPVERFYARRFEPVVLRGAAKVIAPNEFLRDELRARYGVEATVIHNPCDLSEYEPPVEDCGATVHVNTSGEGRRDEVEIVYTGAVYEAHFDALRNLIKGLEQLKRPGVRLHLYSASPVDWEREGIQGPVVLHGHREVSEVPGIQKRANILFLPLAFRSPYPVLIRTSGPSKLGEYLAARRPILVHAPADSFVSWYIREHECGLVVDREDPAELASAIERVISDASLRERLSERAWERARADFSVAAAQAAIDRLLRPEQ
ncbi:MAG: glycosyltransferase [Acidobacteriota bacterium]|nr:glycosyltransferase [Acidobacteriota bacterium]